MALASIGRVERIAPRPVAWFPEQRGSGIMARLGDDVCAVSAPAPAAVGDLAPDWVDLVRESGCPTTMLHGLILQAR